MNKISDKISFNNHFKYTLVPMHKNNVKNNSERF